MPRIPLSTTANSRQLRNEATAEERALWTRLRHIRPRFTRQLPVGPCTFDFACRTIKLVVELDGSQHLDAVDYGQRRTNFPVVRHPLGDTLPPQSGGGPWQDA